jgi:GNAT superfamily N-acetyltransferase
MDVEVGLEDERALAEYASVPIHFRVERVVDVDALVASAGSRVESRAVANPYIKDYDAYPDNGPLGWASRFDLSRWGFFGAYADGERVGGAAVAMRDSTIALLDGGDDLALLVDLRVDPSMRQRGVGRALLKAVVEWSVARGARRLLVETQDLNVPACRFYARNGFVLDAANRGVYPDLPDETQLLWLRELE